MEQNIAKHLLEIEAVFLRPNEPFTWASGIKSPIYCDNRLTLSYPVVRKGIATGLKTLIEDHFSDVDVVAGTATAGIPHAAWVSDLMNKPMIYVRSSPKGHGKGNQIEGKVTKGQKVVIVEDLISTGGSVLTCVEALEKEGCEVVGVVAIFTYSLEKGKEMFAAKGLKVESLTNYDTLINVALDNDYIQKDDVAKLEKWKKDPSDESWMA